MGRSAHIRQARPLLGPMLLASSMLSGIPAAVAADAPPSGGLETVVVTAQKRSENLQKVPMNVQAITTQKLQDLHLTNFTDFQMFMPSVTFAVSGQGSNGGPGFANVTMRGIASDQNGNHSGPLPTVGIYLDEQPITTIGGTLDIPTYDIARVEALSGPQGTLYGASAESGVIRIITNKPDPSEFEAGYSVEGNKVDHGGFGYTLNGFVNEPITDKIAVRLVAWDEHDAGYIDNVFNTRTYPGDPNALYNPFPIPPIMINNANRVKSNYNTVDKYGARAALGIDLDDNWTITPSVMLQREQTNGVFGYNENGNYGYSRPLGDLKVSHFLPEFSKDNWYQAALTVQGKIGDLNVTYAGAYMNRTINAEADYTDYTFWYETVFPSYDQYLVDSNGHLLSDPSQYIIGKDRFTKHSEELRVSSPSEDRLRFVAGLFYERQSHHILQDYIVNGYGGHVDGWPSTVYLADELRVDRDYAAFGEASFDILPGLTATAGIRFFRADNSLEGFFGFQSYESRCFAPPTVDHEPCTNLNAEVKDHGETHRINLTWQLDDDHMVYATYSTGFRPGGVNRRTDIPGVGPYAPDTLDNYELGWKTSWDDNRLRFNGDFFWEDWNKFQFPFLGPNSITIIANAGQARVKGVETEVSWLPIDNLTLTGSAAYTDAELTTTYCNGDCATHPVQSPAGTQLPITPKWKLNATGRYEWNLWENLGAHVQASLVHESGRWQDLRIAERQILGKSPAFTTVDLVAGISRDNWVLDLSLLNAFDTRAELGRYGECAPGTCGSQTYILPSRPRTVALTFSQRF
ncbi:MAG: TonB-dependent receptor [Alphaproteobacteria bacterium]|nr:TonB-dependent receptor [Alphaproteobacteria bacterium]MBV9063164.1 TonB-dependent receptor [Alphaproteobacteria bacterium]